MNCCLHIRFKGDLIFLFLEMSCCTPDDETTLRRGSLTNKPSPSLSEFGVWFIHV